ncbi:MAG: hypothetical protein HKN59_06665, partial [Gammaproteobacteria bacterium]|nr:hypothetical protein [Gammaproteobacteria bacterium]
NIRYELASDVPVAQWAARFCGCEFCVRHGGVYASHPSAALSVAVGDPEHLGRYRFATASANFCFCGTCGVLVFLTCDMGGGVYGLVNMNTLDERPAELAAAPVMSYEGESPEARLLRRKENWIAKVKVQIGG